MRKGGIKAEPLAIRFERFVDKSGDCWLWTGQLDAYGYGAIAINGKTKNKAHRLSWQLANGPIQPGLCVLHRCDVRACVRPEHLFLGSQSENMSDMEAKGRRRKPLLTPAQSESLVAEYAVGGTSYSVLAKKYGVSETWAYYLVNGQKRRTK